MSIIEAMSELEKPSGDPSRLSEAKVVYALWIIENYQIDIRERGLDATGFCQGEFYQRANRLLGLPSLIEAP